MSSYLTMDYLIYQYIITLPNKPTGFKWGNTYESIEFYDGTIKPTKEEFDKKINELLNIELYKALRIERNKKLVESDWTQVNDCVLSNIEAWKTYRQALRDLPQNSTPELDENGGLTNVTWPTPPS